MEKFKRQKSNGNTPNVDIDFGAAANKVARTLDPDDYKLRVESARTIGKNGNVMVALDLIDTDSGRRVATQPLWVDGPNAGVGNLVAENQFLIAQLLTLAKLPTSGDVAELIPQLAGLEFDATLVLSVDGRSGRTFNAIADVLTDDAA
jgi:hypothetical protein